MGMRHSDHIRLEGRICSYHPGNRKLFKSLNSLIFFGNLFYWHGKGSDKEGWIYKSVEEIEEETALSYKEQLSGRKELISLKVLEEKYDRMSHTMYYRLNLEVYDNLWDKQFGNSPYSQRECDHIPDGNVVPIYTLHTLHPLEEDKKVSLPKQKPLDPKVQRVLDAYNKVAEHHGWVRQDKIPGNATAKDSLYKRMEDQQFMEHLDSYVEKLKQIDWFDPQRIVFFLRPRTFMKVMTGEWVRTGATPSPQNTNQHKPTEVKKLMPWDIVKPDPGRIVPQWEKTNG